MKKGLFLLLFGIVLTGCNDKIYTVEDFKKDKKLTSEFMKKCLNGELDERTNLNCKNAKKANYYFEVDHFWKKYGK